MTTAILTRVPLDRITGQARQVHLGRIIAAVLAGVLFGLGWLVARSLVVAWFAVTWCACAVLEGWREGRAAHAAVSRSR